MEPNENSRGRSRLLRVALTVGLAAVALRSFRRGQRAKGVLAGAGALAVGYAGAATNEATERGPVGAGEPTGTAELRCSICGQPIRPGQRRVPGASGGTVHESCAGPVA